MTDARSNILARLQAGHREPPPEPVTGQAAEQSGSLDLFIRGLEKVSASHETIHSAAQIGPAIEAYLQPLDAGNELLVTPAISNHHWLDDSALQLLPAPTRGEEKNAVTLAYAGIAETGSLVMLSSGDTPVTTNFLPDNFICLLKTQHIVPNMEALWARLRHQQQAMPRSINLITGPSRTADVELTIQMGAHGPRRVHVILWDNAD